MVRSATLVSTFRSRLPSAIAQTNYLEDDWNDNKLTNRDNPTDGFFTHPQANEAGDTLIGRTRPVWETESGSPSATNQQLELSAGDTTEQNVSTPTGFTTGSWEFDFKAEADPTSNNFVLQGIREDANNKAVRLAIGQDGTLLLEKEQSGAFTTIVSGSWGDDLNTHTLKITRDSFGAQELFNDGASQGTGTDTFLPTPKLLFLRQILNAPVNIDNLVVV